MAEKGQLPPASQPLLATDGSQSKGPSHVPSQAYYDASGRHVSGNEQPDALSHGGTLHPATADRQSYLNDADAISPIEGTNRRP